MLLLAAGECRRNARVRGWLESLPGRSPIVRVEYADLRQSMRNGGGPACLRLRVPLTAREWSRVPPGVKLDDALYRRLKVWAEKHYRDRLMPRDLADPALLRESRDALDALTGILGLGALYPFQR
jgi:succinylarginine dihydrolase